MKHGNLVIDVKSESVGPAHDPYHRESVRVQDAAGNVAVWVTCGLMGDAIYLYIANNVKVRELKAPLDVYAHDSKMYHKRRQAILKMNLLFKRHVGIRAYEAEELFNEVYYSDEAMEMRAAERAAGWDPNP